jgi:hypothetical protein
MPDKRIRFDRRLGRLAESRKENLPGPGRVRNAHWALTFAAANTVSGTSFAIARAWSARSHAFARHDRGQPSQN